MADNAFWPGERVQLRGIWTSTGSVEVDPTAIKLYYVTPIGTVTTKAFADLTKETTGTYYYIVTPTTSEAGEWLWGYKSTAGALGANLGGRFRVLDPPFST